MSLATLQNVRANLTILVIRITIAIELVIELLWYLFVQNLIPSNTVQDYTPKPDVCVPSPCGFNSQCSDKNEKPSCSCLPGMIGSPPHCNPECISNTDCAPSLVCENQKCKDPCPGSCGNDGLCQVNNHIVYCTCPNGFTGDPFSKCYRVQQSKTKTIF